MGYTIELKYTDGRIEVVNNVENYEIHKGCVSIYKGEGEYYEEKFIPIFQLKEWTVR